VTISLLLILCFLCIMFQVLKKLITSSSLITSERIYGQDHGSPPCLQPDFVNAFVSNTQMYKQLRRHLDNCKGGLRSVIQNGVCVCFPFIPSALVLRIKAKLQAGHSLRNTERYEEEGPMQAAIVAVCVKLNWYCLNLELEFVKQVSSRQVNDFG
jgi:hypothetical protein